MWQVKQFSELSTDELFQIYQLRSAVFVVEQDRLYQDVDVHDKECLHLMNVENNQLVSYARIFMEGDHLTFGRVVIAKDHRGTGMGSELVKQILKTIKKYYPDEKVEIHAEDYVQHFYEKFGFKRIGDIISFNNSPHVKMVLQ
jgi:ElaA protein